MTSDEKWRIVEEIMTQMYMQNEQSRKLHNEMCIAPESPLFEYMSYLHETMLNLLEAFIDDKFGTLTWFFYDCEIGNKPKDCTLRIGGVRSIKSFADIRWAIEGVC